MLQKLPAANQPGQPEAPRLGIRLLPHSTQRVTVLRQPRGPMGKPESEAPKYSHVFLLITVDSTAEFHRLLLIPQSSSHFPISSVNGKRTWVPKDVASHDSSQAQETPSGKGNSVTFGSKFSAPPGRIPTQRLCLTIIVSQFGDT